ncbi:uncharacterized protein [Oscarella lobularis]|uniref:uncharacterized protein n=1 Tax=Oscarella lobularis TaxID=121494 RepID=UPI0033140715
MSIWAKKQSTTRGPKGLPIPDGTTAHIQPINTGFISIPRSCLVEGGSPTEVQSVPCLAYLIRHPVEGCLLFDMGLTSRHLSEEAASVGGKKLSRSEADRYIVSVQRGMNVNSQLAQNGIEYLERVILSHHISSKADLVDMQHLPTDCIQIGPSTKSKYVSKKDSSDLGRKLEEVNFDTGPTFGSGSLAKLGPFERMVDVYGDGCIYIVDLPGPCQGHMGLLVKTEHEWALLTGLAIYLRENYQRMVNKGKPAWKEKPPADSSLLMSTIQIIAEYSKMPQATVYTAFEPALLSELADQFLTGAYAKLPTGYWKYIEEEQQTTL